MKPADLRIEGRTTANGYIYVLVRDHPRASKKGYVYEHRLVMEQYLGRFLHEDEVVHHKNKNKTDNRVENLEVKSPEAHSRDHGQEKTAAATVELICPKCGSSFTRLKSRTTGRENVFCSHGCVASYYHSRGRLRKRTAKHGSASMYSYHKCRCEICKQGHRDRARAYRQKQKDAC